MSYEIRKLDFKNLSSQSVETPEYLRFDLPDHLLKFTLNLKKVPPPYWETFHDSCGFVHEIVFLKEDTVEPSNDIIPDLLAVNIESDLVLLGLLVAPLGPHLVTPFTHKEHFVYIVSVWDYFFVCIYPPRLKGHHH